MTILVLTYAPTISDSDAVLIIFRKILALTWMVVLINVHLSGKGIFCSGLLSKKWYPPTLLLDFNMDMYKALEEHHRCMSYFYI